MKTKYKLGAVYKDSYDNKLYIYLGENHFFPLTNTDFVPINPNEHSRFPKGTISFSIPPIGFYIEKTFENYKKDGINIGDIIEIEGKGKHIYLGRREHPHCVFGFGYAFLPFNDKEYTISDNAAEYLLIPNKAYITPLLEDIKCSK